MIGSTPIPRILPLRTANDSSHNGWTRLLVWRTRPKVLQPAGVGAAASNPTWVWQGNEVWKLDSLNDLAL